MRLREESNGWATFIWLGDFAGDFGAWSKPQDYTDDPYNFVVISGSRMLVVGNPPVEVVRRGVELSGGNHKQLYRVQHGSDIRGLLIDAAA